MYNKINKTLGVMVGDEVSVSLIGNISTSIHMEDFEYWINKNDIDDDKLILRNNINEQEIDINIDEIHNANGDNGELLLFMNDGAMIQITKQLQ